MWWLSECVGVVDDVGERSHASMDIILTSRTLSEATMPWHPALVHLDSHHTSRHRPRPPAGGAVAVWRLASKDMLSGRAPRIKILTCLLLLTPGMNDHVKGGSQGGRQGMWYATPCMSIPRDSPSRPPLTSAWRRAATAERLRAAANRLAWDQWHPWGVQPWPSSIAPPTGIYLDRSDFYYFTDE